MVIIEILTFRYEKLVEVTLVYVCKFRNWYCTSLINCKL